MLSHILALLRARFRRSRTLLYRRAYIGGHEERSIVERFHELFYDSSFFQQTWATTTWMGTHVMKCPFDLWIYQEIMWELQPDLILECGTAKGGSALFIASICDLIGKGRVMTVDIQDIEGRPQHPRVQYLTGSSTAPETAELFRAAAAGAETVMVILDSDHSRDHVLNELCLYSSLVTPGSYLIVEDTNVNGNPILPDFGPGPMEAVEEFIKANRKFIVDRSREKLHLTFNPSGYLKRIR